MEAISLFQSLQDETRLRILALLAQGGELCVCDLMTALQLPQSTVSRHLSHLKSAGWINDRREAVWSYYSLVGSLGALHRDLLLLLERYAFRSEKITDDRERLSGTRSSCE